MKMRFVFAAVAGMCLASGAHAQAYVGGGLGMGKLNLDCAGTVNCDTSTTTGKVFGGYMFNEKFGIEGAAINFGKATAAVVVSGTPVGVDIEHKSLVLALSARQAFSPTWSLVSRVGVASNKATAVGRSGGFSASISESTVSFYGSIGVAYTINQNVSLEAAVESTTFKDPGNDKYGAYFGSVGLRYSF